MRVLIFILAICSGMSVMGQHSLITSQYLQNALPLNPAVAGNVDALAATLAYRNEWINMPGAPVSMVFSGHSPLKNQRLAMGLNVWQDSYGPAVSRVAKGIIATRHRLSQGHLSVALSIGFRNQNVNYEDLVILDENDQILNRPGLNSTHLESGFGILYEHPRFFMGISVPNIGRQPGSNLLLSNSEHTANTWKDLPMYSTFGYRAKLNDDLSIRAIYMGTFTADRYVKMDLTALARYKELIEIGMGVRTDKGLISTFRFWINQQFSIAYSYDMWMTSITHNNGGSHEWILRYSLNYKEDIASPHLF